MAEYWLGSTVPEIAGRRLGRANIARIASASAQCADAHQWFSPIRNLKV